MNIASITKNLFILQHIFNFTFQLSLSNYLGRTYFNQKAVIFRDTLVLSLSIVLLFTQEVASPEWKFPYFYDLKATV